MNIIKSNITPQPNRTLNAKWSIDLEQDLKVVHGIDVSEELKVYFTWNQTGIHIEKYKKEKYHHEQYPFEFEWAYKDYAIVGLEQEDGKIKTAYVKDAKKEDYENEILTEQDFKEKYFVKGL